jgi:hypothetical protein
MENDVTIAFLDIVQCPIYMYSIQFRMLPSVSVFTLLTQLVSIDRANVCLHGKNKSKQIKNYT